MKEEILAAVMFFIRFIEKSETFPRDQLENFKRHLTELLVERFEKHWFPEVPTKGQGYRCIRINGISPVDLTLESAASRCGLSYSDLHLPHELTVWVDPSEVCYRLGESEGSYCTLASFPSEMSSSTSSLSTTSADSLASTPTHSPPSTPLHDKYRKVQNKQQQMAHSRYSFRYNNNNQMAPMSLRMKPTAREMNFNFNPNRPSSNRCDGPPYPPMMPSFFRSMNYNRTHYKNVVRV